MFEDDAHRLRHMLDAQIVSGELPGLIGALEEMPGAEGD